jgi:preprotein translocase subunit SecD
VNFLKDLGSTISKRIGFWLIILLTMLTIIIDWPTVSINGTTLHGPDLEQITNNALTRQLDIVLGLDLQGGTYVALKGNMTDIPEGERSDKLDSTRSVIKSRVDQFGISESNVYASVLGDEYRIIVELPGGGENVEEQIDILRQTANLEFWSEKPFEETLDLQTDNQQLQAFEDPLTQYFNPSDVTGGDLKTAS